MNVIRKIKFGYLIFGLVFFSELYSANDWSFKLKSKVELRSWKLNSKAIKNSTYLKGATVKLMEGTSAILQTVTDADGNFEMNIPSNGYYTLMIEYPDNTSKKFAISTRGNPPNKDDFNFKPIFNMVGIIMSRPATDVKYLGLDQTHVQIVYEPAVRDLEKKESKRNYNYTSNIYDGEYLFIQKFCTANKLGDIALEKKEYEKAKLFYLMAGDMMTAEVYPKTQLKKAEDELKIEKANMRKPSFKKAQKQVKQNNSKQPSKIDPKDVPNVKIPVEKGKTGHKIRKTLGE